MRVFILTVLSALALVQCQDYSCPKGKSKTKKIVLSPGDSFSYNTNFDDKYYPKTKCPVVYKAAKKCKAGIRFSCDSFDLPNRDSARCRKGDRLILGKKAYCGSTAPDAVTLTGKAAKKGLRVLFASDKKNVGDGAQCTAVCLEGAATTTTAAPTTTAGAGGPSGILDNLVIDSSTIGVSGFSSGAMMATQMHVAFSKSISGAAPFAGAPYLTGGPDLNGGASVEDLYQETLALAEAGLIDPVENMREDQVYIFTGTLDSVVPPELSPKMKSFYSRFMEEDQIELKNDIAAEHGFPSANNGGVCSELVPPNYVNFCNYNGAAEMLKRVFGPISDDATLDEYILRDYDQNEFVQNGDASTIAMDSQGYIFVPSRCENRANPCHLHLHFHGCTQGRENIGDGYIRQSGLLPLAEANNIVMVFPQIKQNWLQGNPFGCWNFWGYLGDQANYQYATKEGYQLEAVARLVERVANISMF